MIETREPDINIEALKTRIQQAIERREAEGQTSFAKASAELFELLRRDDFSPDSLLADLPASDARLPATSEFSPQPNFVRAADDHYHVSDLLKYENHQFIWNAYLALLKREPDEEGFTRFLERLHSGQLSKIDILARLRYSPEGKRMKVTIDGLRRHALIRRVYRLPALALSRVARVIIHQKSGAPAANDANRYPDA
jgi:hypothetical protein